MKERILVPAATKTRPSPSEGVAKRTVLPTLWLKIACPSVALKALRFPESTSSTQTAPLATIGGPARNEGPFHETLKEGLGPRLTFSATRPSGQGTYGYGGGYAFPPYAEPPTPADTSAPRPRPHC